ncbi:MAG: HAD family hydrolase [Deltaproteobacteria bacterium]|nr:HAD family hydrolase [Deltaproteobacteria bacterium]
MNEHDRLLHDIKPLSPLPTFLNPTGKLEEGIHCILFDVYGTLFISGSGDISIARKQSRHTQKLKKLLNKYQIKKTPQIVLDDFFSAIEIEHNRLRKTGIDFPEVEIDRIWTQVLEMEELDAVRAFAVEFEMIINPVYPMPNLKKMLSGCKKSSVLMGIISNAQFFTPYLFSWFLDSNPEGLGFTSDLIFYSYKSGRAKPSLFMFEFAAKNLRNRDIPAHSVLYIGNDMLNDIYPAKMVGFKTALFAGDARSLRLREKHPKCQNLSADLVITDLIQILDHVNYRHNV